MKRDEGIRSGSASGRSSGWQLPEGTTESVFYTDEHGLPVASANEATFFRIVWYDSKGERIREIWGVFREEEEVQDAYM